MHRTPTLVAAVAAGLAIVCAASGQQAPAPTDVVATVGDTPIFRSELDAVLRRSAGLTLPGMPDGAAASGGAAGRTQWLEAAAIEQLVDSRLLRNEIDRERITVGRLDIDARLDQLKKQVAARGLQWETFLEQTGREEIAVREQIELEIALDRLVRPKLTPAVISAGFERYRREIDGTRLRVSHIVLRPNAALGDEGLQATIDRAAAIRRDIVQGQISFADAARRHSAGPSRLRGGDLGWITRDAPLIDAFARQVFKLAKGDISKPFMTPFGVHVVQLTAVEPGRVAMDAMRPKLESLLASNLLREMLVRLRAATPVTFAAGVTHFDPATPADGESPRRIVVGGASPR